MKQLDPHWFYNEDESYHDYKVKREDVRFPSHVGEKLNGEVTITYIDKVNQK